jgi:tetratricopeptide (TPR) repeat protein
MNSNVAQSNIESNLYQEVIASSFVVEPFSNKKLNLSDSAQEAFSLGIQAARLEDWRKAVKYFKRLVELYRSSETYLLLGGAYYLINETNRAAFYLRKAAELKPNNYYSQRVLGLVYIRQGKLSKALPHIRKAISLKPFVARNYIHLGCIHNGLHHWQFAIEAFEKAIELDKKETLAYFLLAILYKDLGLLKESEQKDYFYKALEILKQLLKVDPKDVPSLNVLGSIYHLLGNLEDAEKAFEKALKLDPDNTEALNNLRSVKEDQLEQRLFELGFLKRINKPITDFTPYKKRVPIKVKGKPISETIIEERR